MQHGKSPCVPRAEKIFKKFLGKCKCQNVALFSEERKEAIITSIQIYQGFKGVASWKLVKVGARMLHFFMKNRNFTSK